MPTRHGCDGGSRPAAPYVVMTGAPSRSASRATASPASRAPVPAQISGRSAAARRATASSSGTSAGEPSAGDESPAGTSAPSRSVAISRYTGLVGAASTSSIAAAAAGATCSAVSPRCTDLVTGANIAPWSVVSCSTPRYVAGRRRVDGMSVAITSTGDRAAHASPTAPSVLAAPGPVVVMATPSRPVARE